MLASHVFRPRTSVRSRNAAVDSAFVCPLYRGRVAFNYRVLYVVTFFTFAALSQRRFYLLSTHLAIHIVDLHLYQQPPILCYLYGALPTRRRFSAYYYSSSRISCSFSIARRRRVSWLVSFGAVPLQGALVPRIRSSIWRISFSTGQSYTVDALYIAVASIYTSIGSIIASRSSAARSILLQAPVILRRYQLYSFSRGARELFASGLPFRPIPQIWAPQSIIGLTTTVYSSRVRLKEGPQVKAAIRNTALKATTPLQVACVIYAFQFSLASTQTPKTLRVVSGFASQPWILTVDARSLFALLFLVK